MAPTAAYTAAEAHMPSAAQQFAALPEPARPALPAAAGGELQPTQCMLYASAAGPLR